jgi:hypothetical protein
VGTARFFDADLTASASEGLWRRVLSSADGSGELSGLWERACHQRAPLPRLRLPGPISLEEKRENLRLPNRRCWSRRRLRLPPRLDRGPHELAASDCRAHKREALGTAQPTARPREGVARPECSLAGRSCASRSLASNSDARRASGRPWPRLRAVQAPRARVERPSPSAQSAMAEGVHDSTAMRAANPIVCRSAESLSGPQLHSRHNRRRRWPVPTLAATWATARRRYGASTPCPSPAIRSPGSCHVAARTSWLPDSLGASSCSRLPPLRLVEAWRTSRRR